MAARNLRHYSYQFPAADINVRYRSVTPTIPANRALVISKLAISLDGVSIGLFVWIGPIAGQTVGSDPGSVSFAGSILRNSSLFNGEAFTETGLIVQAGEAVCIHALGTANQSSVVACNIFGEEVDN